MERCRDREHFLHAPVPSLQRLDRMRARTVSATASCLHMACDGYLLSMCGLHSKTFLVSMVLAGTSLKFHEIPYGVQNGC